MNKVKPWVLAARLRTLPLSLSGIVLGNCIAYTLVDDFSWAILLLSCLTTILFQVLSNFANDYGDGVKGSDKNRTGEMRAVASGLITAAEMKKATILFAFLSILSSLTLILLSFPDNFPIAIVFFVLALLSVAAAIKYTVGGNAYGYLALGDFFVFIFFGFLAVVGSFYLHTKEIWLPIWLPATAIGFLCVAVLNLNNMRDAKEDKLNNKITLVNKLGVENAKIYHALLISIPFLLTTFFVLMFIGNSYLLFSFWIVFPILLVHLIKVMRNTKPSELDSELKKVAISTFLFAFLLGISIVLNQA